MKLSSIFQFYKAVYVYVYFDLYYIQYPLVEKGKNEQKYLSPI